MMRQSNENQKGKAQKENENVVLAGLESPRSFYFHFFGIFVLEKPPRQKVLK